MAFPNLTDLATTTIENRSKKVADNVLKNNLLLSKLEQSGKVKPFSGGTKIVQELSFQANANAGFYSGYEPLPIAANDVITAAEYEIKQAAVAITISGLEKLQNSGKEKMLDLLEERTAVAEASLTNLIADSVYSDGTGYGGKEIGGLDYLIEANVPASQTGTAGAISRSTWSFWRNQYAAYTGGSALTSSTIQGAMNAMWASLVRGSDRPNLIIMDTNMWKLYMASLQPLQRFTEPGTANLGFPTVKFMDCDVGLDGGIGGFATSNTIYFLNTKYLFFRPHRDQNMVALSPGKRTPVNQDAEIALIGWAGNMAMNGGQFQGRILGA